MLGPRNFLEVCAASTRVCYGVTGLRHWGGRRGAEQGDSGSSGLGLSGDRGACPQLFLLPIRRAQPSSLTTPTARVTIIRGRGRLPGAPLPSLRSSARERSALPPRPVPRSGRQASSGCQDHPVGGAPCPSWSLLHGTPPPGGSWPLARGPAGDSSSSFSQRTFLGPGPVFLTVLQTEAPSFSQIIRDIQARHHSGKESACRRCQRRGFDPWVGKIPWRRKWQPTPVFLPGRSHSQGNLAGYRPWGHKRIRHD